MNEVIYKPSRWGELFHGSTVTELLGAGSAGPGKSFVLLMDPIAQVLVEHERCSNPNHPYPLTWGSSTGWALHLRRISSGLEVTKARAHRIFPQIDSGVKWNEAKNTFVFSSGYRYQFGHCKDPNDWTNYLGAEFSTILWDEVIEFDEEQYDQICTRLRSSDPVLSKMLKIRLCSNPAMTQDIGVTLKDPNWVRRRFVDPCPEGKTILKRTLKRADGTVAGERTMMYLPATLYDNPDPDFVRNYELTLLAAKPHIKQALLYGDWYVTVASFFAEVWNQQLHVCDPFTVPGAWRIFRSMDWGFKAFGCVHWWAVDDDDTLWCIRELTFKGKTPKEVCKLIKGIEQKLGVWTNGRSQISGVADTQLWEKRGDDVQTKAEAFAENGVVWMQADKRSRQRNSELLYERLGDHMSGTSTPGIVIFRTCPKLIQSIPSVTTDPKNMECPADGGDDHWIDSAMYACAHSSRHGVGVSKDSVEERDDDDDPWQDIDRGRDGYGSRY